MSKFTHWRNFWILWIGGLIILAALVSQSDQLVTEMAPSGMLDHQSAGTADRVNEIHRSWEDAGKVGFAKVAMLLDLLFIVMYSAGGVVGALLVRREARSGLLKALGTAGLIAYALFGFLDLTETLCQTIQLFLTDGNDTLAWIASIAQPPKFVAFFAGFPVLVASLVWLWVERRRAANLA